MVDVSSGVEPAPTRRTNIWCARFIQSAKAPRSGAEGESLMTAPLTASPRSTPIAPGPICAAISAISGGRYVAETLMPLLLDLEQAYLKAKGDPTFHAELGGLLTHLCRQPSPLDFAERLTRHLGGGENLFQARRTESHRRPQGEQLLGQIMLAKRMGKTRIIAETGAGQHGVATATQPRRCSGCRASSTWAPSTSSGRSRTCSA